MIMSSNLSLEEEFWRGSFGDKYIERNQGLKLSASNLAFFARILDKFEFKLTSVCEFGSNIGLNLESFKKLIPDCETSGVEINSKAYGYLNKNKYVDRAYNNSIFDINLEDRQFDLTFTKGVLIHINPDLLKEAYKIIYNHSKKYILLAEYYNPFPVEIDYRGFQGKLYKRDFAGEMLDSFSNLKLKSYGLNYKRDINFPQDDITWFLMEKN